jgi:4-hydroxy-2-oxoheptanedioate aldolase
MTASVAERLRDGGQLVGTFLQIPHRVGGEVAGTLGFDLVCVDAEHSVLSAEGIADVIAGAQLAGCPALVRVASIEQVGVALDCGAAGVIVPRINTAAEAARVVDAALYPPHGSRGAGPSRATGYGESLVRYLAGADAELLVGVQVETESAVACAGEISAVPGIDLVFVGPGDLAVSVGGAAGFATVDLTQPIDVVLDAARAESRATGIFAPDAETAAAWLDRGVNLVLVGSDLDFLRAGARGVQKVMQR